MSSNRLLPILLGLLAVVVAVVVIVVATGGDDGSSEAAADTVELPAHDVEVTDGAPAHSTSKVRECSSMDLDGDAGSAAFGGFQDVSVRGISCEDGKTAILAVHDTYADGKVAAEVDGYACSVIDRPGAGLTTVRCVADGGKRAFRFTIVAKRKRQVEMVTECGSFGRFYDVSVRGQSCAAGAGFLQSTPVAQLERVPQGTPVKISGQSCNTLYVEGTHRTVRCTSGRTALRFTIAPRPSRHHPKRHTEKPSEASEQIDRRSRDFKPSTDHGLSPSTIVSCNEVGPFDAITTQGVACSAVATLLTDNQDQLQAIQAGQTVQLGDPPLFACRLISGDDETETVRCKSPASGATFRASFVPANAQPGDEGNPPANTVPDGGGASASAAAPADGGDPGATDTTAAPAGEPAE